MRAAVYARISDDREALELGIKRQTDDGLKLVAARGGQVVMECSDNDISATYGDPRPGFEDIMDAVVAGRITHIVVFHLSRLCRNRVERAEGIELLKKHRISVLTVKGPELDMTTAYGRAMAGLLGEFDTMESEVKSERTARKMEELAERGEIGGGGRRPYGYRRVYTDDGPRRKILRDEIEPGEADHIRDWAARLLGGESLASIVVSAQEAGLTTSTGGVWRRETMRQMLYSGRIAGLREHRGRIVGKAVWPAIIDKDTHERLRELLAKTPTGVQPRRHYLSGLVFCDNAECVERGVAMKATPHDGRLKYKCPPRSEGGCNGRVVGLEPLRDLIDAYMVARLTDPLVLRELAAREEAVDEEMAKLVARIDSDERRLALLQATLEDEDADEAEMPEVIATVRVIRKRIAAAREEMGRRAGVPRQVRGWDLAEMGRRWGELSVLQKQALLRMFVQRILIAPGRRGPRVFDPNRVRVVPAPRSVG